MQTWPALRNLEAASCFYRRVDVGIAEHDRRRVAAELHRDPLHVLPGERRELLADRRRAGEGDLADDRVRDQVRRNLRRDAEHQVQHARRQPGIDVALHQRRDARRCLLRAFQDHRAAGRERCRNLAHGLVDREVPRRERGDRPDRLLHDHLGHALGACRHDAAVGAARFLGEPVHDVGGQRRLELRFGEGLALLGGHQRRDLIDAAPHDLGGTPQQLAALERRNLAPGLEALVGRVQRFFELGRSGVGEAADRLAGGRADDRAAAARGALGPFAVDEQVDVGVHVQFLPGSRTRSGWPGGHAKAASCTQTRRRVECAAALAPPENAPGTARRGNVPEDHARKARGRRTFFERRSRS